MSRKVALITGVTGQDGSYLAEFLLAKGYEVHGLIRRSSTFNTSRIDHIYQDPHDKNPKLFLHYGDLIDGVGLTNLIREIKPTEVYNLGAQSHVQVSFTMPQYTGQVDAVGAVGLLEAIRSADLDIRFYQASTSELFGSTPPPQNEDSVFRPQSPYAAAKLMAYWCTVNYRDGYGLHATNGILFNHESPRRGETFVTRKITRAVAAIKAGKQDKLFLGNLTAVRDWGYAKEYVDQCGSCFSKISHLITLLLQVLVQQLKILQKQRLLVQALIGKITLRQIRSTSVQQKLMHLSAIHQRCRKHLVGLQRLIGKSLQS